MSFIIPHADTRQRVRGTLVATNRETITEQTPSVLHEVLMENGMRLYIGKGGNRWEQGILDFNSNTRSFGGHHVALMFIRTLQNLLQQPGIIELALKGNLVITTDTSGTPSVFKVSVENGTVTYQQANLTWEEPVTLQPTQVI